MSVRGALRSRMNRNCGNYSGPWFCCTLYMPSGAPPLNAVEKMALVDHIESNSSSYHKARVHFYGFSFGPDTDDCLFVKGIFGCRNLVNLNLERCGLDVLHVGDICEAMRTNCGVTELRLEDNYLGEDGFLLLIAGLGQNRTLSSLDLDRNEIYFDSKQAHDD